MLSAPPSPSAALPVAGAPPPGAGAAAAACPNCGAARAGRYCPDCGQSVVDLHVPFRQLAHEALEEALGVDSRIARTLRSLLTRPGQLTAEYLDGRRARYTSPLKLYLAASVVYFLVASLQPSSAIAFRVGEDGPSPAAGASAPARSSPPPGAAAAPAPDAAPRSKSALGAALERRLAPFRGARREEANARLTSAFLTAYPRVLFLLVPVMAALLALLERRARRYYGEHLVFALHAQSFGFLVLLPAAATNLPGLRAAGALASGVYLAFAMRRVYGGRWGGVLARLAGLAAGYLVALVLGVGAAALWAVFTL